MQRQLLPILMLLNLVFYASPAGAGQEGLSKPPLVAIFDIASEAVLSDPHDLVLGPDQRLYVADKNNNRIAILNKDTLKLVDSFGEGELLQPRDISFDSSGKAFIADTGNNRVAIFNFSSGKAEFVGSLSNGILHIEGAAVHPNGRIYVTGSSTGTSNVVAFENDKIVKQVPGLFAPHDVEVGPEQNIWVADTGNARIVKFSPDLKVLKILDSSQYGWMGPRYFDFDEKGRLLVVDQNLHRTLVIEQDGSVVGVVGEGWAGIGPYKFDDPEGVTVVGSAIYISDSDNNRIVRYIMREN